MATSPTSTSRRNDPGEADPGTSTGSLGGPFDGPLPRAALITVIAPDGNRWTTPIDGDLMVIGRSERIADLVIPDEAVSRRHAELAWDKRRGWIVRDLQSRNGIRINGKRIEEASIGRGDLVGIGNHAFALVEQHEREPLAPAGPHTIELSRDVAQRVTLMGDSDDGRLRMADLQLLVGLAEELRQVESLVERRTLVCERMLRAPIHARAAAILRMPADGAQGGRVDVLSGPHAAPGMPTQLNPSEGLLGAVARTRAAAIASTEQDRSDVLDLTQTDQREAEAALACPLDSGEGPLEVLYITTSEAKGHASTLALASLCAHQFQQTENALVAGQQAEARARIERELDQAREIQRRLVPEDGVVGKVELAVLFQASRWVAGDYVDAVPMGDGSVLIIVADVCGKGLAASLVASTLHAITRTAAQAAVPLPQLFEMLNRHLCAHLQDGLFVTAAACALDPATSTVLSVNAGHPPPVLVRADGTAQALKSGQNFPLGIAAQSFTVETVEFDDADTLAMCSDGVTEMHIGQRRLLGLRGFTELLSSAHGAGHQTVAALRDDLEDRLGVLAVSGDDGFVEQSDDCTLVVASIAPASATDASSTSMGSSTIDPSERVVDR